MGFANVIEHILPPIFPVPLVKATDPQLMEQLGSHGLTTVNVGLHC